MLRLRGVAQPGRALRSGRRGRRFKSSHPDQSIQSSACFWLCSLGSICLVGRRWTTNSARNRSGIPVSSRPLVHGIRQNQNTRRGRVSGARGARHKERTAQRSPHEIAELNRTRGHHETVRACAEPRPLCSGLTVKTNHSLDRRVSASSRKRCMDRICCRPIAMSLRR